MNIIDVFSYWSMWYLNFLLRWSFTFTKYSHDWRLNRCNFAERFLADWTEIRNIAPIAYAGHAKCMLTCNDSSILHFTKADRTDIFLYWQIGWGHDYKPINSALFFPQNCSPFIERTTLFQWTAEKWRHSESISHSYIRYPITQLLSRHNIIIYLCTVTI